MQPEHSKSYFSIDCEYKPHIPANLKDDKCSIWLYRSLESHSLSQKLSWLLSDKTHLLACYQSYAFLCQEKYAEATLICLRAIEHNQPSLISEINPCLFVIKSTGKDYHKVHRRCSSFPDNHFKNIQQEIRQTRSKSFTDKPESSGSSKVSKKITIQGKLKAWSSLPSLQVDSVNVKDLIKVRNLSKTTPSTPIHNKKISPSMIKVDYTTFQHKPRKSTLKKGSTWKPKIKHVIINNQDIVEHTAPLSSSQSSGTLELSHMSLKDQRSPMHQESSSPRMLMNYSFLALPGEKDYRRKPKKSFIEDGGMSVLPMATGYFPKPTKGQSLLSFLSSSQFARANAELDRENAHFKISEAIISAMEQIKCKKDLKQAEEQLDDSDPEIVDLKQRIRLRRRQKMVEHRMFPGSLLSDERTDSK